MATASAEESTYAGIVRLVQEHSHRAGGRLAAQLPMTGDRVATIDPGKPLVDGHRLLTVAAVEPESERVTSYWLASPAPVAGQFLPFAVDVPGHGVLRRAYTISAYEAGRCRLSIKRERLPGQPAGRVSNHVHDHWAAGDRISAGAPRGRGKAQPADRTRRCHLRARPREVV